MQWGLLLRLFSLYLGFIACAHADAVSRSLFAETQMNLRLRDGHVVQLYFPEKDSNLQAWVDGQTQLLFSTEIGLALCRHVLNADVITLQNYLAVSNTAALQMALSCANYSETHAYVDNYKISGPIKMTKSVAFEKRHYQFLLSQMNQWPFDSWTDASTNQTVIISQGPRRLDADAFLQSMAHEFAIYFDGQYSVGTKEWWAIHENENFEIISPDIQRLFFAVNNPVIAAILSYMRAFRVEQTIFDEIRFRGFGEQLELISGTAYNSPAFNFLYGKCDHNCLMNFVKSQSMALSPYALALTAYSGAYKDKKIADLLKDSPYKGRLLQLAVSTFNSRVSSHSQYSMLPFIALVESMDAWVPKQLASPIQDMFNDFILPEDLAYLDEAQVTLPDSHETVSFLQWILKPVLSGRNVDFSSGPRPRIRTGGGGYGN